MSITLIASGSYGGGTSGGTSGNQDIGSPDLLLVWVSYQGGDTVTLSDNKGNTYTKKKPTSDPINGTGTYSYISLFYAWGSITGGSTVTFTLGGAADLAGSLTWQSYTGTETSSDPLVSIVDACRTNGYGPWTTIQPGAITATSGDLLSTGFHDFTETTRPTIDSSFTVLSDIAYNAGTPNHYPIADAYKISTGTSDNPTWTTAHSQLILHVMMAQFAAASGGSPARTDRMFFGA